MQENKKCHIFFAKLNCNVTHERVQRRVTFSDQNTKHMNYKILYDNPQESLLQRIFKSRETNSTINDFLNPTLTQFRKNPNLLSDMDIAVERIIQAMKKKEKIMIFGDYDVDGITASYSLYTFFKKFLKYSNMSIMFPHRRED